MTSPFRWASCLTLVWFASTSVVAQDAGCPVSPEEGPLEVTPADAATGVTRNAIVRVRYSPGYFAGASTPTESITLTRVGGAPVLGSLQLASDDTLFFVPSQPLEASSRYVGEASGAAFPFEFSFTTGTQSDVARPDLRSPTSSDGFVLESSAVDSACYPVGSRRVRISFPSASDDGPSSSLEYWVYITRGREVSAPALLTRVRDYGGTITNVGLVLEPSFARSAACLMVVAVDGVGRATEWPDPVCFDPGGDLGFVGLCATGEPGGRRGPRTPIAPLVLAAALGIARARGARRRSPISR